MKKIFIAIAFILVVAGFVLAAVAVVAAGFDFTKLSTVKYVTENFTSEEEFSRIRIDSKETDIIFKRADDGKFTIVCEEQEKMRSTFAVENGTLKIGFVDKRTWFDHLTMFRKSLSMTIYLPADNYEELTVECRTGDISVPSGFRFGSVNIKTSTGDIYCGASAEGTVRLATGTGDVELLNTECSELKVTVRTGDVTLKNVIAAGNMNIETSTGDVRFDNCDAAEITVSTSTGDVAGTLMSGKIFKTHTSTGSVSVPGIGSGGICDIRTSTGDINIKIAAG